MPPGLRKLALTVHVTASVGWLGAVAAFLALAVSGLASRDATLARAAYVAMEPIALWVIVPLALAALVTGIVQSLGTPWGLFRHYWVIISLVVTAFATVVLLLQLDSIGTLADAAAATALARDDLREARVSLVGHAGGGLLVLLVPLVLNIYKPRGMTRYGRRKLDETRSRRAHQPTPVP